VPSPEQITRLLLQWGQGDEAALEHLMPLVYKDLRKVAGHLLRNERLNHTLQATALVNEAYLRLADDNKLPWQNRTHFFAVASRVMRHVLVDHARHRKRNKRGTGMELLPLDEAVAFAPTTSSHILALNDALDQLAKTDLRKARVVEMRYFGGLTSEEIAAILQTSPNTVTRDWNMAKAWLRREIDHANHRAGGQVEQD
jgi:RNA polymerase sigma-70 factor, ECF subfamily